MLLEAGYFSTTGSCCNHCGRLASAPDGPAGGTAIMSRQLVIFVHGLGGHPQDTWGAFPSLLAADSDLKHFDVGYFSYPTSLFRFPFSRKAPQVETLAGALQNSHREPVSRVRAHRAGVSQSRRIDRQAISDRSGRAKSKSPGQGNAALRRAEQRSRIGLRRKSRIVATRTTEAVVPAIGTGKDDIDELGTSANG